MHYPDIIKQLQSKGIIPGLTAMTNLLEELGHPEEDLRILHIAGTNGKGSVFAFLSAVLQEAGYKIGRYVSPAVTCYEEHFQINGTYIEPNRLEEYYHRIDSAVKRLQTEGKAAPTLFEAETAIAFLYFKEENTDYALIETGMGGLLDATNVVKHPVLTVISSISYDHMAMLGNTLEEIAAQKAGIIKEEVPVILSENPPEVSKVVMKRAKEKHSPCIAVTEKDYSIRKENYDGSTFLWEGNEYQTFLPGNHQVSNAITALTAAKLMLPDLPPAALRAGIAKTRWPGRLEIIGKNPLIYRDGAHNPDGAAKLALFLQKHFTNRRILYIMGVLKDKEYDKMLSHLLPLSDKTYVFRPANGRGLDAVCLAEAVRSFGKEAVVCEDVLSALQQAKTEAEAEDILVVCGSLSFMEEMTLYLQQMSGK